MKSITIPQEAMDYLEGLWYMAEGVKQLIRFLASQERTEPLTTYLNELRSEYTRLFTEYSMALNMAAGEYAKAEVEAGQAVAPNFALGVLSIVEGTGC
jgi:hypothetical protein